MFPCGIYGRTNPVTTSLAGAVADTSELGEYRGKKITSTSIAIRNAGDGLSKAMEIAPEIYEPGDTVFVLLECTVDKHNLELIEKADTFECKQVFKAGTATVVDDQASKKKIAAQRNRIEKAQEDAKGVQRIPGTEDAIDGQGDGLRPVPDWDDKGDGEHEDDDERQGD